MTSTDSPVHFWPASGLRGMAFDPVLAQLMRDEPVSRIRLPHGEGYAWLVTRHRDVKLVTSDPRFSRHRVLGRPITRLAPHFIPLDDALGFADPPDHTRMRRAAAKAFSAKNVDRARSRARVRMDGLVDAMRGHGPPSDLVARVHGPLPLAVISDVMGVPEVDRPRVASWGRVLLSAGYGRDRSERAKQESGSYFRAFLRAKDPDPDGDLGSMVAAAVERAELTLDEAAGLAVLIQLSGAHAVQMNSGNMMYTLLTHPEQLARLRAEPDLLPRAVDELLRWVPHRNGVGMARIATEDVEIGGVRIAAGDAVYASYLAANRDTGVFHDPDRLDFHRAANPHLAFGYGPHHCIGSTLARMECEVIVSTLLDRLPGLRLAVPTDQVEWHLDALIRGPKTLPVSW